MVRIADIFRQKGQIPEPEPSKQKEEQPPEYIEKRETQFEPEESQRIYNRALEVVKSILNNIITNGESFELTEAKEIVKTIVDRIALGDRELILCTANYSEDDYLYIHAVNVCIYSIYLGLALGYNKAILNEIGLAAFLHDVGITKVLDIIKQPRKLTTEEYAQIKKHLMDSSNTLRQIKDINEEVIYIVKQHHEGLSSKDYYESSQDSQIREYAQIISLVNVYEALTHPRPYREAFHPPHEVIKEFLRLSAEGKFFEAKFVKLLINRIGLYPVGSWIELNTGEMGKVIASNDDFPLRPKVNIIFGQNRERLPKIKPIDLSHHTNIYIKQSINPQKLNLKLE